MKTECFEQSELRGTCGVTEWIWEELNMRNARDCKRETKHFILPASPKTDCQRKTSTYFDGFSWALSTTYIVLKLHVAMKMIYNFPGKFDCLEKTSWFIFFFCFRMKLKICRVLILCVTPESGGLGRTYRYYPSLHSALAEKMAD